MRGAPIPPSEYDGEHLDTDEKLTAEGWAAGLDVWEQVGKGYSEYYLKDDTLGNAQLWSLQEAIRAEERARLEVAGRLLPDGGETRTEWAATYRLATTGRVLPPNEYHVRRNRETAQSEVSALVEDSADVPQMIAVLVMRTVRSWSGGSSYSGPWVEVTDAST